MEKNLDVTITLSHDITFYDWTTYFFSLLCVFLQPLILCFSSNPITVKYHVMWQYDGHTEKFIVNMKI